MKRCDVKDEMRHFDPQITTCYDEECIDSVKRNHHGLLYSSNIGSSASKIDPFSGVPTKYKPPEPTNFLDVYKELR